MYESIEDVCEEAKWIVDTANASWERDNGANKSVYSLHKSVCISFDLLGTYFSPVRPT